jgi:ribosomal protein L40E
MAEPVFCSQCGARNPAAAEWCGQCFASLSDETAEETETPTAVIEAPPPASRAEGKEPSTASSQKSGTWVCSVCEISNPLAVEECSACGTSIFRSFGAAVEEQVMVDPQRALLRSVMFPGLGHAYAKQGLLGSAIGGLALMSLGFGIGLVASGVGSFGWPLLLQTVGVWAAAAFDAYRIAGGQATNTMLLKPRVITALVGSAMVTVILAATLNGRV